MHVIRLAGPWEYQPLARTSLGSDGNSCAAAGALPLPGRVKLPSSWHDVLGRDFFGQVRLTRRFHCPTGLNAGDRVHLAIRLGPWRGFVQLNDSVLGIVRAAEGWVRFDITGLLTSDCQLTIEAEWPRGAAHPPQVTDSPLMTSGNGQDDRGEESPPGDDCGLVGDVRLEIEAGD